MKVLALFAGLLALATPVAAQAPGLPPIKTGLGTRYYSGPPPARFVKAGLVRVIFVHPDQIMEVCGVEPVPGMMLMACARMSVAGDKIVVMPHPCLAIEQPYALLLCHEVSHSIGGWPGDHPA